jgi:hypothetical protein
VVQPSKPQEAYKGTLDGLGIKYDTVDAVTLLKDDLYWVSAYPMVFFFTGSNDAGDKRFILEDEVR